MKISHALLLLALILFIFPLRGFAEDDESFEDVVTENDSPVAEQIIEGDSSLTSSRAWHAPDFSNQDSVPGYNIADFQISPEMKLIVDFWISIYTKYTTDQGVIHDVEHPDVIYGVIDFSEISSKHNLTDIQREIQMTKLVKQQKKLVIAQLRKDKKHTKVRFQLGQKDRFIQGIYFSGRYIEEFEKIFKEQNIPMELTRIPFVESSFNILARSKVGASGLFQLMPLTVKPYRMVRADVDLRNQPFRAAEAASKIFKQYHNMINNWPLAITGYNHGPSGILKLMKKWKANSIEDLISKNRLGFASRNFYASFLAALEIERNAPKYFGQIQWSQPLGAKEIILPAKMNYKKVLEWFAQDDHKAQIFNPHINPDVRKNKIPLARGTSVFIPEAVAGQIFEAAPSLNREAGGDTGQ